MTMLNVKVVGMKSIDSEYNSLTVIMQNDNGVIFKSSKLPPIFNVYILKGRSFKNGTCNWKICIEHAEDNSRHFIIDSIVGSIDDAIDKLEELLN